MPGFGSKRPSKAHDHAAAVQECFARVRNGKDLPDTDTLMRRFRLSRADALSILSQAQAA